MASNPLIKKAKQLGWTIDKGSKHYKLFHPVTRQTTILPYGSHFSTRTERRIYRQLQQGATTGVSVRT